MKQMLLKKDVDSISVANMAFALLQMINPVAASVSDVCWQVVVYDSAVDLGSQCSGRLQVAEVFSKTFRSGHQLKAFADYHLVCLPLIHPELALPALLGVDQEVAKRKVE